MTINESKMLELLNRCAYEFDISDIGDEYQYNLIKEIQEFIKEFEQSECDHPKDAWDICDPPGKNQPFRWYCRKCGFIDMTRIADVKFERYPANDLVDSIERDFEKQKDIKL